MTIIAAAIKNGVVSIACDSQFNLGSLKIDSKYRKNNDKLLKVNDSIIGLTGWCATTQILEHLAETEPSLFKLNTRWEIFEMLLTLHEKLKDYYFIETSENSDQPVESNQLDGLIINQKGIFEFGSYREVHQYDRFWAVGSGKLLALGAMHALYETDACAMTIVEAGVKSAAEFDDGCSLPLKSMCIELETSNI